MALDTKFLSDLTMDVEKAGVASELNSRRSFQRNGWSVSGGAAYLDLDEGKSREIDVIADHSASIDRDGKRLGRIFFNLHAEVKKSKHPWLVFKEELSDRDSWRYNHNDIFSIASLPFESYPSLHSCLYEHCLINSNNWIAAGVHEAFKKPNNQSRWYSAFLSSIKSSLESDSQNKATYEKLGLDNSSSGYGEFILQQPLVILDGLLLSAELTPEGDMAFNEIDSAAFLFQYKSASYEKSCFRVDLVTLDGLDRYLLLMNARLNNVCSFFSDKVIVED